MSVKNILTEELKEQIDGVHKLEIGTEASKVAINGVGVLVDKINDIERLEIERDRIEVENEKLIIEDQKLELDKKDKRYKNLITICTAGIGATITITFSILAYVYEERGTISSKPGRNFTDKALNYFFKR